MKEWIEKIKTDGKWREFIWNDGRLKLVEIRVELGKRDPDCLQGKWGDDYFKDKHHWTWDYRVKLEEWVHTKLSVGADRDMLGCLIKRAPELPEWLANENLSERVMLILKKMWEKYDDSVREVAKQKKRANDLEEQVLRLTAQAENLSTVDEHYENSVRTLRYHAGMDINLSKEDLLGGTNE